MARLVEESGARAWAVSEIHRRVDLPLSHVGSATKLTAPARLAFA